MGIVAQPPTADPWPWAWDATLHKLQMKAQGVPRSPLDLLCSSGHRAHHGILLVHLLMPPTPHLSVPCSVCSQISQQEV